MSPLLKFNLAAIQDIVTVEPGKYVARLKSAKEEPSKSSGQPMITWTWTLLSGPNKGQNVKSWTSLQEQALSGLKQHLLALGLKGKVNASTDALIGKTVIIVMGIRKGENAAGQPTDFSNVIALFPRTQGDENGTGEPEDAEETTEEVVEEELEETPIEKMRRELAEAEAAESEKSKPKPKPKPETAIEKMRRELAEAEAAAASEEETPIFQKTKPKATIKRVSDVVGKTKTNVDSDETEPF